MDTTTTGQFIYGGISITDWIQALGALIGVLGGVYAFFKLFRRDKDKEKQINSLIKMVEQTTMQTQQLSNQAGHMEESNRLFREQIEVFREGLLLQRSDQEQKEKEKAILKQLRKNDIKPLFYQENGFGSNTNLKIYLKNKGGQSRIIKIKMIEGANLLRIDERVYNKIIAKDESVTLIFRSLDESRNANNFEYLFDLEFENADSDKYSQRFKCKGTSCKFVQPIEIE